MPYRQCHEGKKKFLVTKLCVFVPFFSKIIYIKILCSEDMLLGDEYPRIQQMNIYVTNIYIQKS